MKAIIESWPTLSKLITEDNQTKSLLYNNLVCEKKQTKYNARWGKQYYRLYSKRYNYFPTGLLYFVEHIFNEEKVDFSIERKYEIPKPQGIPSDEIEGLLPFKFRDFQVKVIEKCKTVDRGIIEAPTASGKSLIIAAIIKSYGHNAVILVFNINQATTIKEELSLLGLSYITINSGKLADKFVENPWSTDTVIVSAKTLFTNLNLLSVPLSNAPLLLIDEVHKVAARTHYTAAMGIESPIRFGLSATTSGRADNLDLKIRGVVGRPIYKIDPSDLMKGSVIANAECEFIPAHNNAHGDDWEYLLTKGIVQNTERNKKILEIASAHKGDKVLILVSRLSHGEILQELFHRNGVACEFAHGGESTDNREDKIQSMNKGRLSCLILSPFGSTGINIPDANVLVLAGGGTSKIDSIQKVGRGLRYGATGKLKIYDFMDMGGSVLYRHSRERWNTYKTIGVTVYKRK